MKLRHQHAYIVCKVSADGSQIVVDQILSTAESLCLGTEATYAKFVQALPEKEGRYGIMDLKYDIGLEGLRNKLIFISW